MGFYVLPEDLVILDYGGAAGQCAQMQPDIQRFFYGGCFVPLIADLPELPGEVSGEKGMEGRGEGDIMWFGKEEQVTVALFTFCAAKLPGLKSDKKVTQ